MAVENKPSVEHFLIKLHWKVAMEEIKQIDTFRIDVYEFLFIDGLKGEPLRAFTRFLKLLPMSECRSVLKIWVWLYQHKIKFQLKFGWNEKLPVVHNLKNMRQPGIIDKKLKAYGHTNLMAYQFKELEESDEGLY